MSDRKSADVFGMSILMGLMAALAILMIRTPHPLGMRSYVIFGACVAGAFSLRELDR